MVWHIKYVFSNILFTLKKNLVFLIHITQRSVYIHIVLVKMDTSKKTGTKNPSETANLISRLFFWWMMKLFWKGAHRNLEMADLYYPCEIDESGRLGDRLEREWQTEMKKFEMEAFTMGKDSKKNRRRPQKPSLTKAIVRAFWAPYLWHGVLLFIQAVALRTIQPVFQGWIISYFNKTESKEIITRDQALWYAAGLILTTFGNVFIMHHSNLGTQRIGMQVRIACCSLVYRKVLRLSKKALSQTSAGHVVNLLSNDVNRFDLAPMHLHYIWIMPFQVSLTGFVMWQSVGFATLVGIGSLIVLTIPVQGYLSKLSANLRAKIARKTDRRVQFMSELISGIQIVKMYAWEKPFEKIVSMTRTSEIKVIRYSSYLRGLYLSIMVFTERTALFLTLTAFVLMGNTLTAQITFVLATYFNILQATMAIFFPQAIILAGEALVSIKRLETFLLLDEVTKASKESYNRKLKERNKGIKNEEENRQVNEKDVCSSMTIELKRISANWIANQLPPTLCDVSIKVEGGKLCTLVGTVGSGKSSLLNVLLKELPIGAGNLLLYNDKLCEDPNQNQKGHDFTINISDLRISYCSQDPWLFAATVRENILFGQLYDKSRYQKVTKACALLTDFKQLPYGDSTVVGERGALLSGGQRARINLARAVYTEADIYLLDDPLSAVDPQVGHHLFTECIKGYLKGKTRILVTHQLQYLKQADIIVTLDRGSVKHYGSYTELSKSNLNFTELLDQMKVDEGTTEETNEQNQDGEARNSITQKQKISLTDSWRQESIRSSRRSDLSSDNNEDSTKEIVGEAEVMEKGHMSYKVYKKYFQKGSNTCTLLILLINLLLAQIASSGADYWVSYWTNLEGIRLESEKRSFITTTYNTSLFYSSVLDENGLLSTNSAMYIYTFCIICCVSLTLSRSFLFMKVCMVANRNLHNSMITNILQATMLFFNTNPTGRILNRFSKDVGAMDELLPKAILEALQIFLVMIGILTMVAIVNYWMIIPIIIIGAIFYIARTYYLNTAQDVKRLEGVAKSPVFSHVNATLNGLTTIRSRGEDIENTLKKEFDRCQDTHTGAWYLTIATATAFGFFLDIISCCFVACVCFSFILMDAESTSGGNVGLAISQSLILTGMLQYGVRQSTEVVSQMTSVERILQYTNLPKEGPMTTSNPPPPTWPLNGHLIFKNINMRYSKGDPPVLQDLNVNIIAGWKVGIVGRTGAGKSSLISALFRLTGDNLEGEINIDGIDTKLIGLHELRPCISIIPQEPVLFSESLRYNLDPFERYPDSALWDALKQVELNDVSLDQQVTGGGSNFSIGQQQLICLARAILQNNRILVLDEATANIDLHTDYLIQRTIRNRFADCTVLTIAHRLNTIIDSDRVLVMDGGRLVEFGCPYELLSDKSNGYFARMVQQTGKTMARNLTKLAETAYKQNLIQQNLQSSREGSLNNSNAAVTEICSRL